MLTFSEWEGDYLNFRIRFYLCNLSCLWEQIQRLIFVQVSLMQEERFMENGLLTLSDRKFENLPNLDKFLNVLY